MKSGVLKQTSVGNVPKDMVLLRSIFVSNDIKTEDH